MSPNDLLKLVRCGGFLVIRTRKEKGIFEIKRLKAAMSPIWEIQHKYDNKDSFTFWYEVLKDRSEFLDVTKTISKADLIKIQNQGFRIIKKCDTPVICIKERNKETSRWKTFAKFQTKNSRDQRISEMLLDMLTVLI